MSSEVDVLWDIMRELNAELVAKYAKRLAELKNEWAEVPLTEDSLNAKIKEYSNELIKLRHKK